MGENQMWLPELSCSCRRNDCTEYLGETHFCIQLTDGTAADVLIMYVAAEFTLQLMYRPINLNFIPFL